MNYRSVNREGSTRVSRAGFGVAPKRSSIVDLTHNGGGTFRRLRDGEDTIASTRHACTTKSFVLCLL
jgi:hypothetical protein